MKKSLTTGEVTKEDTRRGARCRHGEAHLADKPRVLAETFRVLRPGGRLGISDVIADDGLDPARRAEAEQRTGCTTGTLTASEYRTLLLASGFTSIRITTTQDAEPGLRSAIIQATRPAPPPAS